MCEDQLSVGPLELRCLSCVVSCVVLVVRSVFDLDGTGEKRCDDLHGMGQYRSRLTKRVDLPRR